MAAPLMRVLGCFTLALLAACTELHYYDYFDAWSEDFPWWEKTTRWRLDGHTAATSIVDGRLTLRSTIPHASAACLDPGGACTDGDEDGLADGWEAMVLHRLRPAIRFDEQEQMFLRNAVDSAGSIGRVTPVAADLSRVRVFIVLAYSRDYGSCTFTAHWGDSERVALDLTVAPDGTVQVIGVYTAAHEGEPGVDHSRVARGAALAEMEIITDPVTRGPRWQVYASRNKHATYLSAQSCHAKSDVSCFRESCDFEPDEVPRDLTLLLPILNAGEPGRPVANAAYAPRFEGLSESSNWYYIFGDEVATGPFAEHESVHYTWQEQPYCGGYPGVSPCSSSIVSKLTVDPFD